ncbi:MAG TPA: cyclic nucleotide-binding domain-containing protein, partial [Acidimicrobiales bacterium]|nr:cyclic nucleotide-binding domain-containing protein [Acidimicrobiales bacterium]
MGWKRSKGPRSLAGEDPRVEVLAASPAFAGCDRDVLRHVAALGTEIRREPDAVLQRPGAVLRQAIVVLEGVVAERPAHGRERAVSAGHVLGEEALTRLHAVGRTTATALTDVRLLVL